MILPNKAEPVKLNYHRDDAVAILEQYHDEWNTQDDWWHGLKTVDINVYRNDEYGCWSIAVYGLTQGEVYAETDIGTLIDSFYIPIGKEPEAQECGECGYKWKGSVVKYNGDDVVCEGCYIDNNDSAIKETCDEIHGIISKYFKLSDDEYLTYINECWSGVDNAIFNYGIRVLTQSNKDDSPPWES
jgi:hypothetical protein